MISMLRSLIEQSIDGMEAGRFQEFCLAFLPIYDARFEGVVRLGGTADGRTRAGTPDLLKTAPLGAQIAVQCGTEERYWPSEGGIETSKPFRDGMKCIETLEHLGEIVLITNRESPPRWPNVKANLIEALQQHSGARITILGLEDLGQWLVPHLDDHRVLRLVEEFCPAVLPARAEREDAERFRLLRAVAGASPMDVRTLLAVVDEAVTRALGAEASRQYVFQRIDELGRCRLPCVPPFEGIIRDSTSALPLREPLGKVWVLTGVPKIGKTSLLRQLRSAWDGCIVQWFECPVNADEACADEVAQALLHAVLPETPRDRLIQFPTELDAALSRIRPPAQPVVVVVDNADELPETGLRRLAQVLGAFQRHGMLTQLACVFATTRPLAHLSAAADEVVRAPEWTPDELGRLLDHSTIDWDRRNASPYLGLLATRASGHPLVALALTRRHPRLEELLRSALTTVGLADEQFAREVQSLLYEDILRDPDAQNFVQRLAVLIDRAPLDVIEALRIEVDPTIATTTAVLLQRLGNAVIEGNAEAGYSVAPVFRDVAKAKVSIGEHRAVYEVAARHLLAPQDRTLVADRVSSGIVYCLLAGRVEEGIFSTTVLLKSAVDQPITDGQLEALLSRLVVVTLIEPQTTLRGRFSHAVMALTFAQAYARLGQRSKATEVLGRVNLEDVPGDNVPEIRRELPLLRLAIVLGRAVQLVLGDQPGALESLAELGDVELSRGFPDYGSLLFEFMAHLILRDPWTERVRALIFTALKQVDLSEPGLRAGAMQVAGAIGVVAKRDGLAESAIESCFPDTPCGRLLQRVATGVWRTERRDVAQAQDDLERASAIARENGVAAGPFWAELQLRIGNAAYIGGNDDQAIEAYSACVAVASADSFTRGWAYWHLGILREDPEALAEAAQGFRDLGITEYWARAQGARGAVLLKGRRDREGLQCFADVVEDFFAVKDSSAGPAATVVQAHLWRLESLRMGNPIPDEHPAFPSLGARPYEDISAEAVPRVGPVVGFFTLAEAFRGAGDGEGAKRYLAQAADAAPGNETDRPFVRLILSSRIGTLGNAPNEIPEVRRRFRDFLASPPVSAPDTVFAQIMLRKADEELERPDGIERMEVLLTGLEQGLADATADAPFWLAEILLRRARIAKLHDEVLGRVSRLFEEALEQATAGANAIVMMMAGHALAFELVEHTGSLRALAQRQFEALRGTELAGGSFETFGRNLFQAWSVLEYRRLSEHDLEAQKALMESARRMDRAGTASEIADPAMVLILARLFDHSGPATEWAEAKVRDRRASLPEHVRQLLWGVS